MTQDWDKESMSLAPSLSGEDYSMISVSCLWRKESSRLVPEWGRILFSARGGREGRGDGLESWYRSYYDLYRDKTNYRLT